MPFFIAGAYVKTIANGVTCFLNVLPAATARVGFLP